MTHNLTNYWRSASLALFIGALGISAAPASAKPSQDIQNTGQFFSSPINRYNVERLENAWIYETVEDDGSSVNMLTGPMPKANTAPVSSGIAVDGPWLWFNDSAGYLHKVQRITGAAANGWPKSYQDDFSEDGFAIGASRTMPVVTKDLVIVGSNLQLFATLCSFLPPESDPGYPFTGPRPLICTDGDGAIVVAIDKNTGDVRWRTKVERHPASKITGSISIAGDKLIVPVAHWEEDWARGYPAIEPRLANPDTKTSYQPVGPKYQCCSARGSVVALDLKTGEILWKTYASPGDGSVVREVRDEQTGQMRSISLAEESGLSQAVIDEAMKTRPGTGNPDGFWGVSAYGHHPTIDYKRNRVYVGMSQNELAPEIAELCEQARRSAAISGQPVELAAKAEVAGLPSGLTCENLNEKLHNYGNAVVALDLDDGQVKWVFHARRYDAWHHGCAAPDFYGDSDVMPFVFPVPLANAESCNQAPVGPDLGFGQHPIIVKSALLASETKRHRHGHHKRANRDRGDLLVVGNKDGRVWGMDPDDNGKVIWETTIDPGGILGGPQWGIATDGKRLYFTSRNSKNVGRDINDPYIEAGNVPGSFLEYNGFSDLGIRTGAFVKEDGALPREYPAPGLQQLPYPGPNLVFGINDYPTSYDCPEPNDPLCAANSGFEGWIKGPRSGPSELWTVINPPSDVVPDGFNVIEEDGVMKTTTSMIIALDVSTGVILWQRPAIDGRDPNDEVYTAKVDGRLTVGNGVVMTGYADKRGTIVALNSRNGELLWKYQGRNADGVSYGMLRSMPRVVGRWVYVGAGDDTFTYFSDKNFSWRGNSYGNRVYGFKLPFYHENDEDHEDGDDRRDH